MARGQDSGLHPKRQVGRDVLRAAVAGPSVESEQANQNYLFGGLVGTQDDGKRTLKRGAPARGFVGPRDIQLAQLQYNSEIAMPGLMQPPPTNDSPGTKLLDPGLGRLSTGEDFPVHSYRDERIKKDK